MRLGRVAQLNVQVPTLERKASNDEGSNQQIQKTRPDHRTRRICVDSRWWRCQGIRRWDGLP